MSTRKYPGETDIRMAVITNSCPLYSAKYIKH